MCGSLRQQKRTTETQMQDREQESIAVVDYEDPSATEAIEAYEAIDAYGTEKSQLTPVQESQL